jgi:hypothetical protein
MLQVEVYNGRRTLVFARRPYHEPVPLASTPNLKIPPTDRRDEDIAIFITDIEMGIPPPGIYELRVGLPLTGGFVSWSDLYRFEIKPSGQRG